MNLSKCNIAKEVVTEILKAAEKIRVIIGRNVLSTKLNSIKNKIIKCI